MWWFVLLAELWLMVTVWRRWLQGKLNSKTVIKGKNMG